MKGEYRISERLGASGDVSTPLLEFNREAVLIRALRLARRLGVTIDVMDGGDYLVSYCGSAPYWWLPGTDGNGMHQISSHGWCWDCFDEDGTYIHHLPREIEVAVLTAEAMEDPVLVDRLHKSGQTAEEYAEQMTGNRIPKRF